jgi:hypothetical protein
MDNPTKLSWSGLNGQFVLDFTIPADGSPPSVNVRQGSDTQDFTLDVSNPTPIQFTASAFQLRGYLVLRKNVNIDSTSCSAVFADLWWSLGGLSGEAHFQGMMVTWPNR